jgi:uncharacterized protein involved in exopolysaccharide biosynthesis
MSDKSTIGDAGMLDIFRFFLRHFLLIFGLSFMFGILAYFGSSYMTPVYRSEIMLVPVEESGGGSISSLLSSFGGLGKLAGLGGSQTSRKDEALALLRSRVFVSTFIAANDGLAILYPNSWDSEANTWKSSINSIPSDQDTYRHFTTSVMRVAENKDTGTITVTIDLKDRFIAAQWANNIIRLLNEIFREHVSAEAQRSMEYLSGELEKASSVELRQVINRLIETQIQTVMLTNVRKDFVFRVIDPAVVQDADYYVSPRRVMLAFLGLIIGGFLGLSIALVRDAMRAAARVQAAAKE